MRVLAVFAPKHRRPEVRKEIDCDNDRHCVLPNFPSIRPFLQPPDQRREFSTRCRCWLGSLSSHHIIHTVTPSGDTTREQCLGRAKHSNRKHHQWISTVLLQHQLPPLIPAVQFQHTSCIKGRRKVDDVSLPVLLLAWIQLGRPLFLMLPLLELAPRNCASLSTHIGLSARVPKG